MPADTPLALYVHWPFCVSKCPYCDFNSHVRASVDQETWRAALLSDLAHEAALLARLRERPAPLSTQTRWSPAHAVLLAGAALAVIAWASSLLVLPRTDSAVDLAAIRAAVRSAPDEDIYRVWKQGLSRSGVDRPPTPEEEKRLRASRFSEGVSRGLNILGGLGAVAAIAAALRVFAQPAAGGSR